MVVIGSKDQFACQQLFVWPLVADVRTHGAAFSRVPPDGPIDFLDVDEDEDDYMKDVKSLLMPKRIELMVD